MSEFDINEFSPIDLLKQLRSDYSDEIPGKKISGALPQGERKFKVTSNWWEGVIYALDLLNQEGKIPPNMQREVSRFMTKYTSEEFRGRDATSSEDINLANKLIDKILS